MSGTVRLPIHQHERKNKILDVRWKLQEAFGVEPTDEEVAEFMGISTEKFMRTTRGIFTSFESLDTTIGDSDTTLRHELILDERAQSAGSRAPVNEMADHLATVINTVRSLTTVSEKTKMGFLIYMGLGDYPDTMTLEEVGEKMGVTRERIRQMSREVWQALCNKGLPFPVKNYKRFRGLMQKVKDLGIEVPD